MIRFQLTEYTLGGAPHDLCAVLIADFHDGDPAPLVQALRDLAPDLILVAGDVVHNGDRTARGLALLRSLITIAPVFCSLGNHECKCGADIKARIKRTDVRLLDNGYAAFGGFVIGGLSSGYEGLPQGRLKKTPAPDTAWLDGFLAETGTHVLLSHHPEYYPRILAKLPIELILSGHAHGGQWQFLGHGVFAPGQGVLPRFCGGAYRGGKRARGNLILSKDAPLLLVSRGLANEVKIPRFGNPPELVVLHFEAKR